MSALTCPQCRCAVSELPVTVQASRDFAEQLWLYCPACRADVEVGGALEAVGVFVHEGELCRWEASGRPELVSLGRLSLRLPRVKVLNLRDICFPAVPRLLDREGGVRLPDLPVRPEYTDLVDEIAAPAEEVDGRYRVSVRFKGRARPDTLTLPFRSAQGEALRGLRLATWPNVPVKEWSLHLVGAWLDDPAQLGGARLEISAVAGGQDLIARDAAGAAVQAQRPYAVRQLKGRPAWVGLRLDAGGRMEAGGCFSVPAATRSLGGNRERLLLGVDFGTSNTYVAWRRDDPTDTPRPVPMRDLDLVLVDGRDRPDGQAWPDTWPPVKGGSPGGSTFPSVLVTDRPAASGDSESWRLGEDVGLMSFDEQARELAWPESEHLVTDLKWGPRTSAGPLPDARARQLFLEGLLMAALANLVAEESVHPNAAIVRWSYPAVFERQREQDRLEDQRADFEAVAKRLSQHSGLVVSAEQGADEARAASVGGTGQDADDLLCIDMGGGTVDILFHEWLPFGNRPAPVHALTSFRFAGHDYVNMLVEGRFLNADISRERLLREVRVHKRLGQRFAAWAFDPRRRQAALKRSVMFYRYLLEVMARLIAARMLDARGAGSGDRPYTVSVQLFGNGWGFLDLVDPDHHYYIRTWLKDRVISLCEIEGLVAPPSSAFAQGRDLAIDCEPRKDTHPKEVVANGLLKVVAAERQLAKGAEAAQGILGISTYVQGTLYPWWLPLVERHEWVTERAPDFPRLEPGQRALWRPGDDPGFAEDLPGLHDIDEGLRESYAHLYAQVMPDHREWFKRSALEVALEDIVRPALPRIAKVSYK
ncbi:MAG: hypothetical protein H6741_05785 [Alphaproteobacteria bacterium]|nr:hypothetical protein [Alphaproteobacteria bacterium]MCB9792218.1 hypothetical protein [Alphaproteobacteria bacterium]